MKKPDDKKKMGRPTEFELSDKLKSFLLVKLMKPTTMSIVCRIGCGQEPGLPDDIPPYTGTPEALKTALNRATNLRGATVGKGKSTLVTSKDSADKSEFDLDSIQGCCNWLKALVLDGGTSDSVKLQGFDRFRELVGELKNEPKPAMAVEEYDDARLIHEHALMWEFIFVLEMEMRRRNVDPPPIPPALLAFTRAPVPNKPDNKPDMPDTDDKGDPPSFTPTQLVEPVSDGVNGDDDTAEPPATPEPPAPEPPKDLDSNSPGWHRRTRF